LLEPLFIQTGVNVVFAGHEHVYERVKPQHGIIYFIEGSSGQLRRGNLRKDSITAKGFDTDNALMLLEVAADEMYFEVVSRTGETVDSETIARVTTMNPAANLMETRAPMKSLGYAR
jgi:hypothetical protein